jgi:outer membrane protein assembly factor BamB
MLAPGPTTWKYSESVRVDQGRGIATPGSNDAALVAFGADEGEELWRTTLPSFGEAGVDGAGYSSVVVSEACGVRQYVQLLGRGVIGVEASSGRFLWGYDRIANKIANIATPLVQDDLVFASTGYNTGSALLRLECGGETGVSAREVYFLEHTRLQNHHGGLVLHDGYVYTGTGHNKGFPIAVELATGEAAWGPIRNEGRDSAAIAYADGRLYLRYQDGLVLLIDASPEGYVEQGSFRIPEVEKPSWPHPVVAGGRLYLREQDRLYVYDISAAD